MRRQVGGQTTRATVEKSQGKFHLMNSTTREYNHSVRHAAHNVLIFLNRIELDQTHLRLPIEWTELMFSLPVACRPERYAPLTTESSA